MISKQYRKKLAALLENTADLSLKRKAKEIMTELNPKMDDKILDVGCGDGYYILMASQLGKFYAVGLEYDPNNLVTAERNFSNLNIKYTRLKRWRNNLKKGTYLIQGDVNRMPFENDFFDKVIMSEVAEHLPNDLQGLKEVYKCLKKGGLLLLTVPNHNYPLLWDPVNWILERLFNFHIKKGFFAGIWNQHIRLYYPEQIGKVIKEAGFEIKKIEAQTRWCLPFSHYLINLGARMIAGGVLPKSVSRQVNKFEQFDPRKRSMFLRLYFKIAKFVDSLNRKNHPSVGTTIFIIASK